MKKMKLNQNYKHIVKLLLDSRHLKTNDFYQSLDKLIFRLIGHKLLTLMVIDQSGKYVERVYSNNLAEVSFWPNQLKNNFVPSLLNSKP